MPPAGPDETQEVIADYARLGFSLGRHPLSFLRGLLRAERFLSAAEIAICPDRKLARAAGIVTCRQRPGTAKGTMFVTLEDETGWVNVIVRPELLEAERQILLGARLLGVYGQITRQGSVVHLHAKRVVDRSSQLGRLATKPGFSLNPGLILRSDAMHRTSGTGDRHDTSTHHRPACCRNPAHGMRQFNPQVHLAHETDLGTTPRKLVVFVSVKDDNLRRMAENRVLQSIPRAPAPRPATPSTLTRSLKPRSPGPPERTGF
jgi:error-prone DNA polymerase